MTKETNMRRHYLNIFRELMLLVLGSDIIQTKTLPDKLGLGEETITTAMVGNKLLYLKNQNCGKHYSFLFYLATPKEGIEFTPEIAASIEISDDWVSKTSDFIQVRGDTDFGFEWCEFEVRANQNVMINNYSGTKEKSITKRNIINIERPSGKVFTRSTEEKITPEDFSKYVSEYFENAFNKNKGRSSGSK